MSNIAKYVNKYSDYLEPGVYKFNDTYTRLYKEAGNINQVVDYNTGTGIVKKIKKIYKGLLYGNKIVINKGEKKFNGTTMLIPSMNYGIKVFSDNEVLTLYNDTSNLKRELDNYKKVSEYINVPSIIRYSKNYYITNKINSTIYDKEEALNYIMDSYIKNNTKNKFKFVNKKYNSKRYRCLFKKIYDKIYVGDDYQAIIQHGDMWSGNVLYNKSFYIIDFENVGDHYFLYDFFKYIYSEAYILNDYKMLKKYFNSKYDDMLVKYFNSLGLEYNPYDKVKYFYSFLNEFIEDRIRTKNLYIFYKEISFIKKVLKKINL